MTPSFSQCFRQVLKLYFRVRKQEKELPSRLKKLLSQLLTGYYETLTPKDLKRIGKYWQLGQLVICESLYGLQQKKLSLQEEKNILLLSVFAPLFDDLTDEHLIDEQQLDSLIKNPGEFVPQNDTASAVLKIYLELLVSVPSRMKFIQHLQEVSYWQKQSLKQLDAGISKDELLDITYNKSFAAVMLFAALLENYPAGELTEILYPLSGLLQLTNDAFDVWKDIQKKVYTLPNLYLNYDELYRKFVSEAATINVKISATNFEHNAKQNYLITMLAVPAMGSIALQHLKTVTRKIEDHEQLAEMSRKELVCDMDSYSQKWNWLKEIYKLAGKKS